MKYKRVIWRNILGKTQLKVDKTGCMVRVQCLPTMYQSYDVISNYSAKLEKHVLVYEAINWDPGVAGWSIDIPGPEASAVLQFVWVGMCAALRCRLPDWRFLYAFQRCESTTILVYRTWIVCFHVFWKLRSQAFSCCLQPSIKVWNEDENRPCTKLVLWPFIVQTKVMCFSDNKGVSEARKRSYLWSMMNMWDASS